MYINYYSNTKLLRVTILTDKQFYKEDIKKVFNILTENNYPKYLYTNK